MKLWMTVALLALGGTAVAQADLVAERQQIMKGFGRATGAASAMLKGERPFDLATAQASLKTYSEGSKKAPPLFADSTKGVADAAVLPAVFEKKDDFVARFAKFDKDASDAAALIVDEASFKANFPKVLGNCGGCHELYRAKKG